MNIRQLIKQAKICLCYPETGGLALRKELMDITQENLNEQWQLLNEIEEQLGYKEEDE